MNQPKTSAAQLLVELSSWLRKRKLTHDLWLYTQWDWRVRGERIGDDAAISIVAEGNRLLRALAYDEFPEDHRLVEAFSEFLKTRGWYWESGFSWSVHLYPL